MIVRLGFWLVAGLGVGLWSALSIVTTVARVTQGGVSRVRSHVMIRCIARYALAVLIMTIAIHDSVLACAFAGLGILVGRWFLAFQCASGRAVRSRTADR